VVKTVYPALFKIISFNRLTALSSSARRIVCG